MCEQLDARGPRGEMSPARVAETLANRLAADPLSCDLLANLHLHLEHEVDIDRIVDIRRTISADTTDSGRRPGPAIRLGD